MYDSETVLGNRCRPTPHTFLLYLVSSGCIREPDGAECHSEQVWQPCIVRYIAPILVPLEASLHSPPCLYQWTAKPPMAPLEHIADIPAVGQELNRVIRL